MFFKLKLWFATQAENQKHTETITGIVFWEILFASIE